MNDMTEPESIPDVPLAEALSERYLAYALSTITARSLPDVRDGLKPVHRRLLYAMRQLRLDPGAGFKKCARVVGDVIGKYHPHGDQAVYDALVRLAQGFAARYPLIDGQGNFGNIDGDGAAAMRYTEARLTEVAEALLADIDQDTVDFRTTYDGSEDEPVVLPARFPNLLANGSSGIAVGMATSIPPHNVGELCDALLHLLKHPKATIAKLVEFVPGPDFPTGGVLVEPADSIAETYATGRGGLHLRARWAVENAARGQYQIVVGEIPYQVNKARLIEKIASLMDERRLPFLADVRDESAEDIRLVLEPKSRGVEADVLMETLFRLTDLEVRVGVNMNVLDAARMPRVMNLRDLLQAFLDHRRDVLQRRTRYRLAEIDHRLEVVAGYRIAYLHLDEIIRIIREEDEAKDQLKATFGLTEIQAEAVLNMRLRALRRLEEQAIEREFATLGAEKKELKRLLREPARQTAAIAEEVRGIRHRFAGKGDARRTRIDVAPAAPSMAREAMIEREPITVICSQMGWIRTVGGHVEDNGDARFKEGDSGRFWLHAHTTDKLLVLATGGRFFTLACDRLRRGRGHGEPLRLLIDLGNDEALVALFVHRPGARRLVAASDGRGFIVPEDAIIAHTRSGRQVLNVGGAVEAQVCAPAQGDAVAVMGDNRKLLIFARAEVPEMARGRGVVLQRYGTGGLADAKVFNTAEGLTWRHGGGTRSEPDLGPWRGRRGNAGRMAPKGFPKSNRFAG